MIPKVRVWNVRVVETGEKFTVDTITKKMVGIIVGMDRPDLWGKEIKISLAKDQN